MLIVKMKGDGTQDWIKIMGGGVFDFATGVIETENEELVVCGETDSFGSQSKDIIVFKMSKRGSLVWAKRIGSEADEEKCRSVSVSSTDGSVFFAGLTDSF